MALAIGLLLTGHLCRPAADNDRLMQRSHQPAAIPARRRSPDIPAQLDTRRQGANVFDGAGFQQIRSLRRLGGLSDS